MFQCNIALYTRRGSDTPVHRPEKPTSSTYTTGAPLSQLHILDPWGTQAQKPLAWKLPPHPTRHEAFILSVCMDSGFRDCRGSLGRGCPVLIPAFLPIPTKGRSEVPASPRDEPLFHCDKPSGVPRGPANSTVSTLRPGVGVGRTLAAGMWSGERPAGVKL